jgi:hypothetical protein
VRRGAPAAAGPPTMLPRTRGGAPARLMPLARLTVIHEHLELWHGHQALGLVFDILTRMAGLCLIIYKYCLIVCSVAPH